MPFLEKSTRTVHYTQGLRQENDDVLGSDYGFPAQKLAISEDERRGLRRSRIALSYSAVDMASIRMPAALLSLTLPVLRRCAAFARHLLAEPSPDLDAAEAAEWARLEAMLEIFSAGNEARSG